jgi:hypothetical protein
LGGEHSPVGCQQRELPLTVLGQVKGRELIHLREQPQGRLLLLPVALANPTLLRVFFL